MAAAGLGEVVGALTTGMASAAQYQASKHERNVAWRRQQQWELIGPSLRTEGLRRAGLNPVLAATQGMTGGPGHVAMGSPGSAPSFRFDTSRVMHSAKQARAMNAEVDRVETLARIEREHERQAVQDTNVKEKFSEALSRAELAVRQQQMLNMIADAGLTTARSAQVDQEKLRTYWERTLMEMGVPGARAMEELYERHPWLRQVREFGGTLPALGAAAAGAGGAVLMRNRVSEPARAVRKFLTAPKGKPNRAVRGFGPAPQGHKPRRK